MPHSPSYSFYRNVWLKCTTYVYKVLSQGWISNNLFCNKRQIEFRLDFGYFWSRTWNFIWALCSFESLSLHFRKNAKAAFYTFFLEDQGSALIFSRWNTSTFDRRIFHSGRCWKAVFPEQLSHSAEPRGPLWTPAKLGGDSRTVAGALSPYTDKSESATTTGSLEK